MPLQGRLQPGRRLRTGAETGGNQRFLPLMPAKCQNWKYRNSFGRFKDSRLATAKTPRNIAQRRDGTQVSQFSMRLRLGRAAGRKSSAGSNRWVICWVLGRRNAMAAANRIQLQFSMKRVPPPK